MQGLKRTRLRISHKLKRTCFLKQQSRDRKIGFSKSKRSQDRFSPSRRIVRIEEVKGYVHSAKEGINRNIDNARPASCMDQAGQKTCALNKMRWQERFAFSSWGIEEKCEGSAVRQGKERRTRLFQLVKKARRNWRYQGISLILLFAPGHRTLQLCIKWPLLRKTCCEMGTRLSPSRLWDIFNTVARPCSQ